MFGWAPTGGGSRWPVCLDIGHPVEKTLLGINIGRRINIRINIRKGSERLCPCPPSTAASEHTLISIFKFQICVGSACLVPPQNAAASSIYSDFKWGARMCFLGVPPTLDFNIQISTGGPASRKCCWVLLLYWKYGIHALTHIGLLGSYSQTSSEVIPMVLWCLWCYPSVQSHKLVDQLPYMIFVIFAPQISGLIFSPHKM